MGIRISEGPLHLVIVVVMFHSYLLQKKIHAAVQGQVKQTWLFLNKIAFNYHQPHINHVYNDSLSY